jgi:hypothetical protein
MLLYPLTIVVQFGVCCRDHNDPPGANSFAPVVSQVVGISIDNGSKRLRFRIISLARLKSRCRRAICSYFEDSRTKSGTIRLNRYYLLELGTK